MTNYKPHYGSFDLIAAAVFRLKLGFRVSIESTHIVPLYTTYKSPGIRKAKIGGARDHKIQ
jgi:hypothetical protein